jgi:hypothetical protein
LDDVAVIVVVRWLYENDEKSFGVRQIVPPTRGHPSYQAGYYPHLINDRNYTLIFGMALTPPLGKAG